MLLDLEDDCAAHFVGAADREVFAVGAYGEGGRAVDGDVSAVFGKRLRQYAKQADAGQGLIFKEHSTALVVSGNAVDRAVGRERKRVNAAGGDHLTKGEHARAIDTCEDGIVSTDDDRAVGKLYGGLGLGEISSAGDGGKSDVGNLTADLAVLALFDGSDRLNVRHSLPVYADANAVVALVANDEIKLVIRGPLYPSYLGVGKSDSLPHADARGAECRGAGGVILYEFLKILDRACVIFVVVCHARIKIVLGIPLLRLVLVGQIVDIVV